MVNFNFSFNPGTSLQQMIGFEIAGRIWSSYLTDNTTINLQVGVSNQLAGNVIGGALPGISSSSFLDLKTQMQADATSTDDQTAISNLAGRAGKQEDFKASFDLFDSSGKNGGTSTITRTFNLTRANAKSLGTTFTDGNTDLDGVIIFGSLAGSAYSWNYDYTRSSLAPTNTLDFLSTAIHEIGHILGMVSGVDKPGWLNSSTGGDKEAQKAYKDFVASSANHTTPLDLFRYSARTLGTDFNDLSYGSKGGTKYFSIDGKTIVAQFSTGKDTSLGGDGAQASHWQEASVGIMDPTLAPGVQESIAALDLRAMDIIGWNLASNAVNLNLDLSALLQQSKQGLAGQLGQTVDWLDANSTIAANSLGQNRDQDIYTMLVDSKIYDLSRITPPSSGGGFGLTLAQVFEERGLFETLDELQVAANNSQSLTIEQQILTLNLSRITPPGSGGGPSSIQIQFWEDGSLDQVVVNRRRVTPPGSGGGPSSIVIILDMSQQPDTSNPTNQSSSDSTLFSYYDSSINTSSLPSNSTTSSQEDSYLSDILDLTRLV